MSETTTIAPSDVSTRDMHQYLLSAVAPRPIAFASTIDREGKVNLSPFSFFNVFSSNPPILVFSPANRGRDNSSKHTLENVKIIPEVAVNMVSYSMVEQMSLASTEYAKGVNEFTKAGFTPLISDLVRPPYVGESPVAFECKVNQIIPLGNKGGAGNLVIAEVVLMHIKNKYLKTNGHLDIQRLDLIGRMGENWYCLANARSLFEVQKPGSSLGIGIDQFPRHIRESKILTGNDLGKLGSLDALPSNAQIKSLRESAEFGQIADASEEIRVERLHQIAKRYIDHGKLKEALSLLMTI